MSTLTVNKAILRLDKLVEDVGRNHEPILIKGKKSSAILLDEEDWKNIEETLYLLSIPKMRESIIEGLITPLNKCTEKIKWPNGK